MSKLDEMASRPPTVSLSTRADARHLATLAKFWHEGGATPSSISELVRLSLESLCDLLVNGQQVSFVTTQEEAQDILGRLGILPKIQRRNLIEALKREGNLPLGTLTKGSLAIPTSSGAQIVTDSPELKEAERRLQELLSTQTNEAQTRTKSILAGLASPEGDAD